MSAATVSAPIATQPVTLAHRPNPKTAMVGGFVVAIIAAAVGALVAWFYLPGLLADQFVGRDGRTVADASLEGECETYKAFFTLCDGEVWYTTRGGKRMTRSFYMMLAGEIDDSGRLIVRVDPDDPSVMSISWGIDALTNRWLTFAGVYLVLALLIWGAIKEGRNKRRRAESLIAAAAAPRPVAVEAQRQQKGQWRVREGARAPWQVQHLPRRAKPLLLPSGQALALLGPQGHLHLLAETGWPLALQPADLDRLVAAARMA